MTKLSLEETRAARLAFYARNKERIGGDYSRVMTPEEEKARDEFLAYLETNGTPEPEYPLSESFLKEIRECAEATVEGLTSNGEDEYLVFEEHSPRAGISDLTTDLEGYLEEVERAENWPLLDRDNPVYDDAEDAAKEAVDSASEEAYVSAFREAFRKWEAENPERARPGFEFPDGF